MDGTSDDSGISTDRDGERTYLSMQSLRHNMNAIDDCRTALTLIGGGVAGVLGLTGLAGGLAFIVMYLIISAGLVVKMKMDVPGYTNMPLAKWILGDMGKYGLSFILFWTLMYALVYIY
jgi:hypothetical protein